MNYIQGDFKKINNNHNSSFKNERQMNQTTLAKYGWKSKQKQNITPTLNWYIIKSYHIKAACYPFVKILKF